MVGSHWTFTQTRHTPNHGLTHTSTRARALVSANLQHSTGTALPYLVAPRLFFLPTYPPGSLLSHSFSMRNDD
jgi:hypothetical protein